ncbi:MAG: hypothetical protein IJB81_11990, partial [Clostridia bacterium]|nr:hypothetical protein [Clostridia bacterium]
MFGKFMNNYYYGKSGKGDYTPEDLPKTRWQLFWEMLRVRFNALCRMNLIYMLPWLPYQYGNRYKPDLRSERWSNGSPGEKLVCILLEVPDQEVL